MRETDVGELARRLMIELAAVFPGAELERLPLAESEVATEEAADTPIQLRENGTIVASIFAASGIAVARLLCRPLNSPDERELQLARTILRLFNHDVGRLQDLRRDREVWTALSRDRFLRTIARFSAFSTSPLIGWLGVIEAARTQTYEQSAFKARILFTKQLEWVHQHPEVDFIKLQRPIAFQQAMLSEKWIRPLLQDESLILVALGHSGHIVGIAAPGQSAPINLGHAPHENLSALYRMVVPGTTALCVTGAGDMFIALPNGSTFAHSQGNWRYVNYQGAEALLGTHLSPVARTQVLQLALNLSFERIGGLFVVLENPAFIQEVIPDHISTDQIAKPLRQSVSGLTINDAASRRLIGAAAHADGAIVLTSSGEILDVACMVGDPPVERLASTGRAALRRFAGARTTAAWNASLYGMAVKVSEDGPIEIYVAGELRARLG